MIDEQRREYNRKYWLKNGHKYRPINKAWYTEHKRKSTLLNHNGPIPSKDPICPQCGGVPRNIEKRDYRCRNCHSKSMKAWREKNKLKVALYNLQYRQAHGYGKSNGVNYQEMKMRHPEKLRARWAVKWAIQSGKLVRQPCELCGEKKSQAHHEDYSKPLDVRWLCQKCHGIEHAEWRKIAI